MHIVLFGGTFDPIHNAHLQLIRAVCEQTRCDELWLLVAPHPVHKTDHAPTPLRHRMAMCKRAVSGMKNVRVTDLEKKLSGYMVDTLSYLKKEHPNDHFSLLIGSDSLLNFHTWKSPETILKMADLIVYPRPNADVTPEKLSAHFDAPTVQKLCGCVLKDLPLNEISSSEIRAAYEHSHCSDARVPKAVNRYILNHLLYTAAAYKILKRSLRLMFLCCATYLSLCAAAFILPANILFFPAPQNPLPQSAKNIHYVSVKTNEPLLPNVDTDIDPATARQIAESMLFHPPEQRENSASNVKKTSVADTEYITILHLNADSRANGTILYFHGNAIDIPLMLEYAYFDGFEAYEIYAVDYRGYGASTGTPSIERFYEDVLCAFDYVVNHEKVDTARLILHGHSLGCAGVIYAGAKRDCAGLICEAPFASLLSVVTPKNPFPFDFMVSREFIKNVHEPVFILHGKRDKVIPIRNADVLFDAANKPKRKLVIPEADHNSIPYTLGEKYIPMLEDFIGKAFARAKGKTKN